MIKCSECGYENMDGLDYCDGCGAKLSESSGTGAASAPAPEMAATAQPSEAKEPAPVVESAPTEEAVAPASQEKTAPPASEISTGEIHEAGAATQATAAAGAPEAASDRPAAGAVPQFKAKLSILRGGRKGREFELESGNNLIGRWDPETGAFPEVDLDQDDPEAKISRRHALIRMDAGRITIEDIGSLNGTFVNRQPRLAPGNPLELKTGDEIIIGKTFLKLVVDPIS
ncbi:MAG: FHA domain-containing protein [Candidatus Binataceae bacterium]